MSKVQVTVHNNSDQLVTLSLDDERDAERIAYLQTLKRRDDLKDVEVKNPATPQRIKSGGASDAS